MSGSRAAIRYAKAVLQQANQTNTQEVVFGEMQAVKQTIDGSKELRTMLKSPLIKAADKKEVLLKIFADQSETTKSFINVLVDNQRASILNDVAGSYMNIYNEERGMVVAHVTTAVALNGELESKVLAKVKEITGSSEVSIVNKIDPAIIGGFVLRVGDLQYNASIANQLSNIKREFNKSL